MTTEPAVTLYSGRLRRGTSEAAGYDLFATEATVIPSGGRRRISTGVRLRIRSGLVGVIRDRSGLAAKQGLTVLAGILDPDYRDEVGVVLLNTGEKPFVVNVGDRIAQLLFLDCRHDIVCDGGELEVGGDRSGGFGSTGVDSSNSGV